MYCLLVERNEVNFDLRVVWRSLTHFKVECFVWELLFGRILTRLELVKRGLNVNEIYNCGLCGASDESVEHLFFFNCKYAQMEGRAFLRSWIGCCPEVRLLPLWKMAFFAITWSIWLNMNGVMFREPPPTGIVKFSTNGTVKGGFGPTAVGGVLKDHSGNMLLKFSNSIDNVDPASAELLAIKKAISLFASSGLADDVNIPGGDRLQQCCRLL
ncbi:hypothetical protein GQ457_12G027800 [Hibiscus cannabinus]